MSDFVAHFLWSIKYFVILQEIHFLFDKPIFQITRIILHRCTVVFTAQRYASAVYAVIVCPSVHLSVTSRHCTKMAKCSIMQTVPFDSPGTLVF